MRITTSPRHFMALIGLMLPVAAMHAATTLVPNPSVVTLNYTKGGTLPTARVTIAPAGTTNSVYFTVNPASLPPWLQVDKTNGTCSTAAPVALTFSPSLVAANSPAGMYSAAVEIDGATLAPAYATINMNVTNAAPTVTASLNILPSSNWTPGTNPPTAVLTVKSSGDPVYFTASASPAWITLTPITDVAYSWGTNVAVTFAPSAFDTPQVGSTLSGSITVKYGATTLPVILVAITIGQPIATITSISPKQLPQIIPASAVRTIAIQGTSFANGMTVKEGSSLTAVNYNCATFATGTTDAWCLQSANQFFLRLSSATLAGTAQTANQLTVYLSAAANGQVAIPVVTAPIVYAVTDAASFVQPAGGQNLNVAPYEMLSIFGDNFSLPGSPIAFTNGRLPFALADANANPLKVHFTDAGQNALAADSDGYLLLWNANQINVLVPSTLPASTGGQELQLYVEVGNNSSQLSNATTFNVVQASPGLLSFGGTQAVVVNAVDNSINSNTNAAKFGGTIVLYLSGMGAPMDGQAFAGNPGPLVAGYAGCATLSSFLAATTAIPSHSSWVTFDGAVIDSSVLGPFAGAPCFNPSTVTVKLGNLTLGAVVTYAGFTEDSIAGLYQVNVALPLSNDPSLTGLLPAAGTSPTAYPIQVSIGSGSSQPNVNVYVSK